LSGSRHIRPPARDAVLSDYYLVPVQLLPALVLVRDELALQPTGWHCFHRRFRDRSRDAGFRLAVGRRISSASAGPGFDSPLTCSGHT
jgi:hypothetical protein